MEIKCDIVDGVNVIRISGELDSQSSPELTKVFNDQLAEGKLNFVADLKGLTYSSSAGIRTFLGSARSSRQKGGDLRIAAVNPQVDKVFKMSKFDRIVKIFPSVEEALESFKN